MIGQVPLHLIDPNPFRDFDLHPIDETQVARLRASIDAGKFWASVVARQVGKRFQLAFGHHRIAAARLAQLEEVALDVQPLTDWDMVLMLTSENATQRGTTAAASLDSVAAISRKLAQDCFVIDEQGVAKIFATIPRDAAESVLGKMQQGEGPGERCILDTAPAGTFTRNQVRLALGVLKDSGRMARLLAEAHGDSQPDETAPPTFDANCARLFKLDYHLHSVGEPVDAIMELGVVFYPEAQPPKYVRWSKQLGFTTTDLDIPGNTMVRFDGYQRLNKAAKIIAFQPHMHVRGKVQCLELIYPNGSAEMINCAHFNYNWHLTYNYADDAAPLVPAGTLLHIISWQDNTTGNKNNPDPKNWVGNGQRTIDEMAFAWIGWYDLTDEEYKTAWDERRAQRTATTQQQQQQQ